MNKRPILYSFRRCPYAMRARLAISSSGQECELREIVLRDKAAEFIEASPKATVPVLVEQSGNVIDESLDLMFWALAQNDPEQWFDPETGTRDQMESLISENDGPFKSALDRYKYPNRYEGIDPLEQRELASLFLKKLNRQLETDSYLFGSRMCLADAAILPFIRQFANVNREWFEGEDWLNLKRWLGVFLESGRFLSIMTKYPKWHPDDEITLFPSS